MRQIKYLLVIMILISTNYAYSQESEKINFWLNAGIGFSSLSLGGNINANICINSIQITGRFGGYAKGIFGNSIDEYALLGGYTNNSENSHFSITGGLSRVKYKEGGGIFSKAKETNTDGLAFEMQYCYSVWNFLGIGISLNANINSIKIAAGINLNLFIGDLNWEKRD